MSTTSSNSAAGSAIAGQVLSVIAWLERIPTILPNLLFRVAVANVFWRSGQTKLANWDLTVALFRDEYRVPVLPPELAAYAATAVELAAPLLLVVGLATRLGAAAMLGMTVVIQIFVYPGSYTDHLLWAGPLLYLVLRGPGAWSVDHLIRRRWGGGL